MSNEAISAVSKRTLSGIRENLSATLSVVVRGATATDRHVVMNSRGEVLNDYSGTWSIDLEKALVVDKGFDPALLRWVRCDHCGRCAGGDPETVKGGA